MIVASFSLNINFYKGSHKRISWNSFHKGLYYMTTHVISYISKTMVGKYLGFVP